MRIERVVLMVDEMKRRCKREKRSKREGRSKIQQSGIRKHVKIEAEEGKICTSLYPQDGK